MEPLDAPVKLNYNYGLYFPPNARIIGYIFIPFGLLSSLIISESIGFGILGLALFVFGLIIILTKYGTKIDLERKLVIEYILFFGFLDSQKKYDLAKYIYITTIPTKHTQTYYRTTNSGTFTNYFFSVCLLNANYRNQLEIAKFDQKSEAVDVAKRLSELLNKEYFDHDPQVIREKILRMK